MTHATDIARRLAAVASELKQLAELLGNQREAAFPDLAKKKVLAGQCLGDCGRTKPPYVFRRGNCPTCSNKVNKLIEKLGPAGEFQLIEEGRLTPEGYNPTPSPLDATIDKIKKATAKQAKSEAREAVKQLKKGKPE